MTKLGVTPNFGQMGTEMPVGGNGPASPYGQANPTSVAPLMSTGSMQGGIDSAQTHIGYRPQAGRADRLSANVVGGGSDSIAEGGYGGRV